MSKKTFKDNPALQFISGKEENSPSRETKEKVPVPPEQDREKAAGFSQIPQGYKLNPKYIEKKTRRLQLIMQPSLYQKVKSRAEQKKISVNEYIHQILESAVDEDDRE